MEKKPYKRSANNGDAINKRGKNKEIIEFKLIAVAIGIVPLSKEMYNYHKNSLKLFKLEEIQFILKKLAFKKSYYDQTSHHKKIKIQENKTYNK